MIWHETDCELPEATDGYTSDIVQAIIVGQPARTLYYDHEDVFWNDPASGEHFPTDAVICWASLEPAGVAFPSKQETELLGAILAEYRRAKRKHPAMTGPQEGWGTLNAEVAELWREVFREKQDAAALKTEAVQVAAMGLRFLIDVCK